MTSTKISKSNNNTAVELLVIELPEWPVRMSG